MSKIHHTDVLCWKKKQYRSTLKELLSLDEIKKITTYYQVGYEVQGKLLVNTSFDYEEIEKQLIAFNEGDFGFASLSKQPTVSPHYTSKRIFNTPPILLLTRLLYKTQTEEKAEDFGCFDIANVLFDLIKSTFKCPDIGDKPGCIYYQTTGLNMPYCDECVKSGNYIFNQTTKKNTSNGATCPHKINFIKLANPQIDSDDSLKVEPCSGVDNILEYLQENQGMHVLALVIVNSLTYLDFKVGFRFIINPSIINVIDPPVAQRVHKKMSEKKLSKLENPNKEEAEVKKEKEEEEERKEEL